MIELTLRTLNTLARWMQLHQDRIEEACRNYDIGFEKLAGEERGEVVGDTLAYLLELGLDDYEGRIAFLRDSVPEDAVLKRRE